MEQPQVTRTVETELSPEALWALVADSDGWSEWMVDRAEVPVVTGGEGIVDDGGTRRAVRVDHIGDDRLSFSWWPVDDRGRASTVELVVLPTPVGSSLRITERLSASSGARATAGIAWEVRTLLLVLRAMSLVTA